MFSTRRVALGHLLSAYLGISRHYRPIQEMSSDGKVDPDMMSTSTTPMDGQATVLSYDRGCGERSSPEPSMQAGFPSMDSSTPLSLQPGVYQHFKGQKYAVVGVAPLVDSDELFVVYRPLYGDQKLVLRSYAEFTGTVTRDGRTQPRFVLVEPVDNREPRRSSPGVFERFLDVVLRKSAGRIFRKQHRPQPKNAAAPVVSQRHLCIKP